ncbi:MAG: purine nucleosidase [Saprospiraceae bacterium]|jgi:purine nucleosidase
MAKEKVLFNHDAAIDEFMAAVLLTTMKEVDYLGSVIMNADCIYNYAMQAQWKIQKFLGISQKKNPISLSRARQWNPFPWVYRGDCIKENNIDCLKPIANNPAWPSYPDGDAFMVDQLRKALKKGEKITMLVNCPMTTLRNILEQQPALAGAIDRLIWMGGAINVNGNLDPATIPVEIANPKAEWNAFCDPEAIQWVFENTKFPITLFPLDVTNSAVITPGFMANLAFQAQQFKYSELAWQSYEIVAQESFYDMWDVLTTCYIPHPEFFATPSKMKLSIVTEDYWQGTLFQDSKNGRTVDVVLDLIDSNGFYQYVLEQFRR